ncbi:MAG: hypothetical protein IJ532_04035 [Alphaproteobacteria bacterium]|nr:hypothetical protein [Alphaproteobacteria bacterium]
MARFPFTDRNGQIFYYNPDEVQSGELGYVVVKKGDEILCMRDETAQLYTLPLQEDVSINAEATGEFEIIAYVIRHDEPVKERQNYEVFEVGNVDLKDMPLEWVKLSDILLGEVYFDATQKNGMKNLVVRGK